MPSNWLTINKFSIWLRSGVSMICASSVWTDLSKGDAPKSPLVTCQCIKDVLFASLMEEWPQSRRVQPGAFGRRNNCSVSSARIMMPASDRRTRHASASSWSSSICAASWSSSLRRRTVLLVMMKTGMIPWVDLWQKTRKKPLTPASGSKWKRSVEVQ